MITATNMYRISPDIKTKYEVSTEKIERDNATKKPPKKSGGLYILFCFDITFSELR